MRPLLISPSDDGGGANRASLRLHKAMLSHGIESSMRVGVKKTDMISVAGAQRELKKVMWGLIRPAIGNLAIRLQKTANPVLHSPALLPSGIVRNLNASDANILNIHAMHGEFLSIEDIGRLRKPLVLTLHDMWAFSGAEHSSPVDDNARWRVGYRADNRPLGHGGLDIDRWVWGRKIKAWRRPTQIITPSHWLASCAKASILMHNWPVTVIPNPLDTRQYQPWPKEQARAILGLPVSATLLLFGAIGGVQNPHKGWDLLQSALESMAERKIDVECVIFGQSVPRNPPHLGLPLHWLGHLNDDVTLSLIYSAADVMVVPSRQENLPQSGTEAQACGCPVVAFNCSGLPDVVVHGETGYLAEPFDSEDLARGILWVLEDAERYSRMCVAARERALRLWSPDVIVPQYMRVYEAAIESYKSRA